MFEYSNGLPSVRRYYLAESTLYIVNRILQTKQTSLEFEKNQYNFFGKKKIIHMCDVICKMVGVLGLNRSNTYWLEEPQLCHNDLIGP